MISVKEFTYWELLFLILFSSIMCGIAIAFNMAFVSSSGIILFYCMWISRRKVEK